MLLELKFAYRMEFTDTVFDVVYKVSIQSVCVVIEKYKAITVFSQYLVVVCLRHLIFLVEKIALSI